MHLLDGAIVLLAVLAAYRGWNVGAVSQILSLAGFLGGLALSTAAALALEPHVRGSTAKLVVAGGLLVAPPLVLAAGARRVGERVWSVLRRSDLGRVDEVAGAVTAVAGTLVAVWLLASVFINSSVPAVSRTIEGSQIIRTVGRVMPPVPDAFATVERYLSTTGFPQVLANIVPESVAPVSVADHAQVAAAIAASGSSVVRVLAAGCSQLQEGTGFAVDNGLVVTNAHVVAGTNAITVTDRAGAVTPVTAVSFDPDLDLALLRPDRAIDAPPLAVDDTFVERGAPAIVLGYPEDGPFDAQRGGIIARFEARGRNIYDTGLTDRAVYEVQADVRPGNSGGPLLTPSGEVIGVIFSRSTSQPSIGYALASPAVLSEIRSAGNRTAAVGTGTCVD